MSELTEEKIFRLGMSAGEVFTDKVNTMFRDFVDTYKSADPNFNNQVYLDGFAQAFFDNVDFKVDVE